MCLAARLQSCTQIDGDEPWIKRNKDKNTDSEVHCQDGEPPDRRLTDVLLVVLFDVIRREAEAECGDYKRQYCEAGLENHRQLANDEGKRLLRW